MLEGSLVASFPLPATQEAVDVDLRVTSHFDGEVPVELFEERVLYPAAEARREVFFRFGAEPPPCKKV